MSPSKVQIDAKNDLGNTPLHRAVYNGHLEICDLPIQVNSYVNTIDWDGRTALHLAVMSKRPNICELLIKHGANVNTKDNRGQALLIYAKRNSMICELLIKHGASNIQFLIVEKS